ncbi:hypothetical protein BH20ACI1_BH20ACI1_13730 [soil metagenome]
MSAIKNKKAAQNFLQNTRKISFIHLLLVTVFLSGIWLFSNPVVKAQSPVSGGFAGQVLDKSSKTPLTGATIRFTNQTNGSKTAKRSDESGYFRQDTLQPGVYEIVVTLEGYKTATTIQELYATRSNQIVPVPVELEKETVAVNPDPTPTPGTLPTSNSGLVKVAKSDIDSGASLNPRRDAAFNERDVRTLPLGGTTLTRSFDELALLAPGVAPPPQAIGSSVGPGVGGGVGTSGQFAVNGLRSRSNNFTVDGADNNDEDIGVRRQGFFALVPQPIESIQEFQIITLLAPAQFGRNLGAQVNALSKSGGNQFHGTGFGFFNSSQLNARNAFDNTGGDTSTLLTGRQTGGNVVPVFIDGVQPNLANGAGKKDSSTFAQGGFAVGGPIIRNKMFFFVSGEGQLLNATKERHFAVPTVEQRGFVTAGAGGLQQCRGAGGLVNGRCVDQNGQPVNFTSGFPTSLDGDAVFSLFPFANDPNGIYGRNTYTQALSADARGRIFSGKYDWNIFKINGNQQTFTARYNYTDDRRDLTDVGGALFSAIRPMVRTDNFSSYLTGSLTNTVSNEVRFSLGRTRLKFEEIRDATGFLRPISRAFNNPDDTRFLLNARLLLNNTLPVNCSPTGCVAPTRADYVTSGTTENSSLGLVGQLNIAGFSPVGVDVFNFPQQRINNTFQVADNLRWQFGAHSLTFGTDIRRTLLDSDLPRNSRPLVTFNGSPDLFDLCQVISCGNQGTNQNACVGIFCSGTDLAAAGAATGFFQSLVLPGKDARIKLGFNQLNFFAQDEWRLNRQITLSYGLRYEYNTVPKEVDNKIEDTFSQSLPSSVASLSQFIDGRNKIFDSDRNNFAPRFGIAAAVTNSTVFRAGVGVYYDQILGSVVSQSRNVFPTFTTLNFGGGNTRAENFNNLLRFTLFNPLNINLAGTPIIQPGTLNTLGVNQTALLNAILGSFPFFNFDTNGTRIAGSAFGITLPQRNLISPFSYQFSIGFEQQLFKNTFLSAAYVGTSGKNLLRFTTPNLGSNYLAGITRVDLDDDGTPIIIGATFDPTASPTANLFAGRPVRLIGPINQFETTGESQYDSLQFELRGRLLNSKLQYQASYVFGKVEDDVSDVFDLAGASALPQNSITKQGEYAPANFDVRHRFTYNFIYDLSRFNDSGSVIKYLLGGWQVAGTGKFNTGQPFTVNSIFDVNLDGNLTDRLDNTRFITETNDRRQPLILAANANLSNLLAPLGKDGSVRRNSFRAGSILDLDLSFIKTFGLRENQNLQFRTDIFNFINRANFGIPVRFLEAPGFGQATDTVTPGRRIQFAVKYLF